MRKHYLLTIKMKKRKILFYSLLALIILIVAFTRTPGIKEIGEKITGKSQEGISALANWGTQANVTLLTPADQTLSLTDTIHFNSSLVIGTAAYLTNATLYTNQTGTWQNESFYNIHTVSSATSGLNFGSTSSTNAYTGFGINITSNNLELVNVTKHASSASTFAHVYQNSTLLGSATFSGNIATFSPHIVLESGKKYSIVTNASGTRNARYTTGAGLPISDVDIIFNNYVNGASVTGAEHFTTEGWEITNIGYFYQKNVSYANFTETISDGIVWNVLGCDSDGDCGFSDNNFTLNLDLTKPIIDLEAPNETIDYGYTGKEEILNFTATDANLTNCFYNYNGTNISVVGCVSGIKNSTTFTLNLSKKNITVYAQDGVGNLNSTNQTWQYRAEQIKKVAPTNTIAGDQEDFILTLQLLSGVTIGAANLIYDGTSYTTVINSLGSDKFNISNQLTIPGVSAISNKTYYFNFSISTGQTIETPQENISVTTLGIDNCDVYTNHIFNFTMYDEDTQVKMQNGSIEINVDIFSEDGSTLVYNYSNMTNTTNINVCLSGSIPPTVNYLLDALVKYSANDYFVEYYNIQQSNLTNATTLSNISLYDLVNETKPFLLNFKGDDFLPAEDVLVYVKRQYVGEDAFKTVELPKTDSFGNVVIHPVPNDVHYTLSFVKNNEVLATFEDVVLTCEDAIVEVCPLNLNALQTGGVPYSFSDTYDILITDLYYNKTSEQVNLGFLSTDGNSKNVTMVIERYDNFGNKTLCINELISAGGDLTCSVSTRSDDTTALIKVYINGDLAIQSQLVFPKLPVSKDLLLIAFFLILAIGLVFADTSENMFLLGVIIGLVISIGLGFLYNSKGIGLASSVGWLIICIAIYLTKLNKRRQG